MGMLHIYYGDGKGKTTAAIGLAIRAAGSGMHVDFVQFLKGGETSELAILKQIPEISVFRCDRNYGFTFQMSDKDKEQITHNHNRLLSQSMDRMFEGKSRLLILDEFFAAYNCRLMDKNLANRLVFCRPDSMEMVLTGRDPEQKFLDAADYVSEIHSIRHPYQKGIAARPGIEY